MRPFDREIETFDPHHRIQELQVENAALRLQRDREMAGRLFAEEMLARGSKPHRSNEDNT